MKRFFTVLSTIAIIFLSSYTFAQVTITSSNLLSCSDTCTTLTAHVIGDVPLNAGITIDDIFETVPNPIGFTFQFYGLPYTSCLIGPNGNICFDDSEAGMFTNWSITAALLGNPIVFNTICVPWEDIDIVYGGTITYSTDGAAPNRKFVVTYCATHMYSCTDQYTTTQAILYESTNIIEIHLTHKDICTDWNPSAPAGAGGRAILGVQNNTGTSATVAPGRDWEPIWSATDEAWRFTPMDTGTGAYYNVASIVYAPIPYDSSLIYWYNASTGTYIGTGPSITVCPTTITTYKAGALGCADTSFGYYTVIPGSIITISSTSSNPSLCGLSNGSISIIGLTPGDIDTINYELGGVAQPPVIATVSVGGDILLTGLCAGTYSNITATQSVCISNPLTVTLTNPAISISGVTSTNPSACGVCDGTITLAGLYPGTLFTVHYNKDGVAQAPVSIASTSTGTITLSGLCGAAPPYAGTIYDNIIASFTNCSSCATPPVGPDTLVAPPPPPANIISSTNATECGVCNGSITIKAISPLTTDSVFYSFNGVVQPNILTLSNPDSTVSLLSICPGIYSGFTISTSQCVYDVTGAATITQPKITDTFSQTTHYGCSGDTVFFQNFSSTPGPLYYIWYFGDGSSDTATNPLHIFAQGVYTVSLVATNNHCIDTFQMEDSLVHPIVAAFIDSPNILCQDSLIFFTNNSVGTTLTYLWIFGNGALSNLPNPTNSYPNEGVYTVQLVATDFVPCHDTAKSLVYVDSLSPISIGVTDSLLCRSTYVTFIGNYTSIGNTGVTWYFGDGDSILNINPVSHAYDNFGADTVRITAHFRACHDTSTSRVIRLYPLPSLNLGSDTSICLGSESVMLIDSININTPGATWKWSTGQTTPSISVTAPGRYYVTVGINGCFTSDSIVVQNDCYMDIPNAFTPGGTSLNNYFFPRLSLTKGLTTFKMDIYNRWGQLVFETTSLDGSGWDGKFNGIPQPEGVYVYVIDATFKDGQKEHHQGNITLLR